MPKAENGEIVAVCDNDRKILGYGFYDSLSQITLRVFEFTNDEMTFIEEYWRNKITKISNWKNSLYDKKRTNAFRLIHAEGDNFPGIIVDIYDNIAVVQILIKGTERLKPTLGKILEEIGYVVFFRIKQIGKNYETLLEPSEWYSKIVEQPIKILENGIPILVDVIKGQKTGFFLDQRVNREILGSYSKNKKVLNTFSYTGGFSLYALNGGAKLVHSVDSSADAIEMCNKNVELSFSKSNHESFTVDVFDYLKNMTEEYDIIVLDPPAFAKNARSVENAAKGYKNLNLQAIRKIKPGGLIFTFSCSQHIDRDLFKKIVFGAAADAARPVSILKHLSQPEDHTINIFHPESEYLKGLLLRVEA
jgi:23S rRNA (cytosine1962-C5)-methyltransferase